MSVQEIIIFRLFLTFLNYYRNRKWGDVECTCSVAVRCLRNSSCAKSNFGQNSVRNCLPFATEQRCQTELQNSSVFIGNIYSLILTSWK